MTIKTLYESAKEIGFENKQIFLDADTYLVPIVLNDVDFVTKVVKGNIENDLMVKIKVPCIDCIKRDAVINWINANRD